MTLTISDARAHAEAAGRGKLSASGKLLRELAEGSVYQTYAGDPRGNLVPAAKGTWCLDTTNNIWYRSYGTTSAAWASLGGIDNAGTANTGTTATEYGGAHHHITSLAVSTTLPAIAGGADLAVGKLLYTFPAGAIIVHGSYMSLAITQSQGNITADTPDGGLGTTIASGVVNVLGGTAAFENMLTGQTFNDCNGTAEVKTVGTQLVIEAADAHTVYFNVADGWAASGDAAAGLAGTVVLDWSFLV